MNKMYSLKQLQQWDADHQLHPYMNFEKMRHIIARGDGAYVYDHEGKKYLDGIGGLWCVNIGHGRKEIGEAMLEQSVKLGYYSSFVTFANEPSILLAQRLSQYTPPGLNKFYFSLGGSEANDIAVRIAHHYHMLRKQPSKKIILSREQAYHGMTYLTASLSGLAVNNKNYHTISDFVHHLSTPSCYRPPNELSTEKEQLEFYTNELEQKIATLGAQNIAAFIAEPIMGAGGVHVAVQGYHKRMAEICRRFDILYISDEVVTGFCRLGEVFSSESIFDVRPDMISIAKGITSGYFPLGANVISDEIYSVIKKGDFTTAYTYSAHPVGSAVALKNLDIIEQEKIGEHIKQISPYLWQELTKLQQKYPILGDIRGSHFMIGLEFVCDPKTKEPFAESAKFSGKLAEFCYNNGLIIRPLSNSINVVSPTLIWQKSQVDEFISIMDHSIEQTLQTL